MNKKERGDVYAVVFMMAVLVFGFLPPFFGIWRLIAALSQLL